MAQDRHDIELSAELNDKTRGVEGGDRQSVDVLRVLGAVEEGGSSGRSHADLQGRLPNLSS